MFFFILYFCKVYWTDNRENIEIFVRVLKREYQPEKYDELNSFNQHHNSQDRMCKVS